MTTSNVPAPIVAGGHTRIRPFNTSVTYPEQNLDNDLCQAVVAGNTVYVRGQIGQDLDTSESVGIGDVEAQTERAMSNIKMLLEESGAAMEHLVKLTIYIVTRATARPSTGPSGAGPRACTRSRPGSSSRPSPGPSGSSRWTRSP